MKIKVLHIGVVEHEGKILMRKKFEGSEPYNETWYNFGGYVEENGMETSLIDFIKEKTGIVAKVKENLSWDTEVKKDHDGEEKLFIYLDSLCEYVSGEIEVGEGLESVKWIPVSALNQYDIVPPSVILFKKLKYLK